MRSFCFRLRTYFCLLNALALAFLAQAQPSYMAAAVTQKFAPAVPYNSGGWAPDSIALGDINGDGKPDIVIANTCTSGNSNSGCTKTTGLVGVLLGNGDGTFQPAVTSSTGQFEAASVTISDLNGDGKPDLVVTSLCQKASNCPEGSGPGGIAVMLGKGNGTFQAPLSYSSGGCGVPYVSLADVNSDGRPDLIVSTSSQSNCSLLDPGLVSVLLGNGDGTFQSPISYSSGGGMPKQVAIADFNGDGHLDLAVMNQCVSESNCTHRILAVFLGMGDGTFSQTTSSVSIETGDQGASFMAIGDLNGDNKVDLVVSNTCLNLQACDDIPEDGEVDVLLGNGDGSFQTPVSYHSGGSFASPLAVADVNGDGKADVIVVNTCGNIPIKNCSAVSVEKSQIAVMLGNGDGTLQAPARYNTAGFGAVSLAIADVNSDGRPDLTVANVCIDSTCANGSAGVLLNAFAVATATALTSSPNPSQVGQPVTFTATITSSNPIPDGSVVTFYQGAVQIGTDTTTNGVATLTTSFSKAKSYTIKAKFAATGFLKASAGSLTQVVN